MASSKSDQPLGPVLTGLSVAAGLTLAGLGVGSIVAPARAAQLFGLPVADDEAAFVTVAGVRDLAAGALVLAFALLGDRRAVGVAALAGAAIPVGDGLTVLRHGPSPRPFVALHWGSAVGALALAAVLLRRGPAVQMKS